MGQLKEYKPGYYLWPYVPSLVTAVFFINLFVIVTAAQIHKLYKTRQWFCLPFVIGGLMEVVGFVGRAIASEETDQLLPCIIQSIFLLLPPILFAASIYMVLARIIRAARGEQYSLISFSIITKTFVWSDAVSFLIQSTGAGMMATGTEMASAGRKTVIFGLFVQIIMFSLFGAVAIVFYVRYKRLSVHAVATPAQRWEQTLKMLYLVSVLIMVRSIFRVFEFVLGEDGYPMQHEWTLYVFDAALMLFVMTIYWHWYPENLERGDRLSLVDMES
ncbi:RTA1 like protein-domain-containing protein [Camillea tinctor]|nr:RTA1 like protein-domain-containing protein [Camillea tinctor]